MLVEELPSNADVDSVSIIIKGDESKDSKHYKATIDKTGNVVEYDFD